MKSLLIIPGFPKCGTTSLHKILSEHPEICASKYKKPDYYFHALHQKQSELLASDRVWIDNWFKGHAKHKIDTFDKYINTYNINSKFDTAEYLLDSSHYSNCRLFPPIMRKDFSNVKCIFIVRNPLDRLFSHYRMDVLNGGLNNISFDIWMDECVRLSGRFDNAISSAFDQTRYLRFIEPYINVFGRENVLVLDYDSLFSNFDVSFEKITDFLNINREFKLFIRHDSINISKSSSKIISKVPGFLRRTLPVSFRNVVKTKISNLKRANHMRINDNRFKYVLDTYREEFDQIWNDMGLLLT